MPATPPALIRNRPQRTVTAMLGCASVWGLRRVDAAGARAEGKRRGRRRPEHDRRAQRAAAHRPSRQQSAPDSPSDSITLNIGGSYVLPSTWKVNGQLSPGLTPDVPNFVFGLRASKSF